MSNLLSKKVGLTQMAKITNASKLNTLVKLGTVTDEYNQNGIAVSKFVSKYKTLGSPWTRTQIQSYQVLGTDFEDTLIYLVRHRNNWKGLRYASIAGTTFEIVNIAIDNNNAPTSGDLLTLKRVDKNE